MDASKAVENDHQALVDVDQFVGYIGEFGKKQIILQIMFCLMIMPATFQTLLLTFAANNPAWVCTGLNAECNKTGVSFGINHDYYDHRCKLLNRSSWQFVQPKGFSIVTEWDLVCDKKELSYLANSAYFLGAAVGILFTGFLSDRFGRKCVLFASLLFTMMFGFISAFVQSFWLFFTLRCVIGLTDAGSLNSIFVLATELVGPRYRALSGTLVWFGFSFALCLIGLKSWLVPDWRMLEMIMSAPYAFVFLFWGFIPESVRWLRVNDRIDEAEDILRKTAKMNGKPPPPVKLSQVVKETAHGTFIDLFRPLSMCKITLIQCFLWFVNGMVYIGFSFASDDLGGNMYRDFILSSLVEFPANTLLVVFANRYGRRKTTIFSMASSALCCGILAGIPNNQQIPAYMWSRVCFGLLGKFFITISIDVVVLWSAEIVPTVVRSQGMGVMNCFLNFGSSIAPWVAQFLRHFHPSISFAVMGGLSMASAGLCFILMETNGLETNEVLPGANKNNNIVEIELIQNEHVAEENNGTQN